MWLFAEFLPELLVMFNNVKKRVGNSIFYFFFIVYFGLLYLSLFVLGKVFPSLLVLLSFISIIMIIKVNEKSDEKDNYSITYLSDESISLVKTQQSFPIKYRDIFRGIELSCCLPEPTKLQIVTPKMGEGSEAYIVMNGQRLNSLPLSHLKIIFLGLIYRQRVSDVSGDMWLINLEIWGVFKPKITLIIKELNYN